MACNGKCKLAQMAKEQDQKDASDTLTNLQQEIFLYHQTQIALLPDALYPLIVKQNHIGYGAKDYTFLYLFRNDKPPEFFS